MTQNIKRGPYCGVKITVFSLPRSAPFNFKHVNRKREFFGAQSSHFFGSQKSGSKKKPKMNKTNQEDERQREDAKKGGDVLLASVPKSPVFF